MKEQRVDVQVCNELSVLYPVRRRKTPGSVVPDHMVVLYAGKLRASTSFNVLFELAPPFWILE